ncbi:MAG: FAD-dependent oxidoreductase, partial [Prolixibacteraceae bacterium]|nr:FAD-dependent oxidoreductase [Prolixibacteraceae bacterium]
MNKKEVIIVGTGLGGLSTALRLVSEGFKVKMVEKYHQAGGRLNRLSKDGFIFDLGPTFFSMSYEFDELVKSTNIDYPFEFIELDPLFTVNIDGVPKTFTIYKDLDKLSEEFASFEPDFKAKMEKHLRKTGQLFHDTEDKIVHRNFTSLFDYFMQLTRVPLKHSPLLFKTMWKELCDSFESKEARMVFSLVGFFLGATPFDTPAIYSLLNYVELKHDGYHNVKGGMYKIVEGLFKVLRERQVDFYFNTEIVEAITTNDKIDYLVDQNGREWHADYYVINADAASFRGEILKKKRYSEKRLDKKKWTMAPLTIYLGLNGKVDKLQHHNYFLGNNFD